MWPLKLKAKWYNIRLFDSGWLLLHTGREGEWTPEELEDASEALGYGAIKYYLSHIVFHAILVRLSIHLKGKFLFGFCLQVCGFEKQQDH